MASTFSLSKYTGVSPGTETAGMSYMHLIAQDIAANGATDYRTTTANQITIPAAGSVYSYEAAFKGKWTGTYNEIADFKVWRSAGPTNGANGVTIKAGTASSYTQPVNSLSSKATDSSIGPLEADAISITVSGASPNTVSDFLYIQATVDSTASPGDHGDSTWSFKWRES